MTCTTGWGRPFDRRLTAAAAVLAALVTVAASAGPARAGVAGENKGYAAWKSFPIGVYVTYQSSTLVRGQETVTRLTHKLVGLTSEKAVVETSAVVKSPRGERKQPPTPKDIPRTVPADAPRTPKAEKLDEGTETVTLGGRTITARFVKTRAEVEGNVVETTVWTSDAVPGGLVKMIGKVSGRRESRTVMELVEIGK